MNGTIAAWVLGAVALLLVLLIARWLQRLDRSCSRFSFDDLLNDPITHTASPIRVIYIGTWIVLSLIVLYGAVSRTLTDTMFTTYTTAFSATLVAKMFSDASVAKAAAAPDPPPTVIDKQVNMTAGDTGKSSGR